MIHCSAVDVVSVPAVRNSEQRLEISSSVSARSPSSGSLMSSSVSTYECSNVVVVVVSSSGATAAPPWFLTSCCLRTRRASINGTKSSFCRCRAASPSWRRSRKRILVSAGQNASTLVFLATNMSQPYCADSMARTAGSSSRSPKHMSTRRQNMAYRNVSITGGGACSLAWASSASRRSFSASTRRPHARAGANSFTRDGCSVSATRLRRRSRHTGP
ncbi:hypothetical protein BDA96_01G206400 [Sorghum bicolor]|uniref:Uncharacterized protein n=1 Tax=Sorghum bicolor TaxID=4558 RepID=A0A921RYR5_SORBI|nr:hypothetical protein BDA96_01G206400 [Sorghum bicolor]